MPQLPSVFVRAARAAPMASAFSKYFVARPTLRQAATAVAAAQVRARYRGLQFEASRLALVERRQTIRGGHVLADGYQRTLLADLLIERYLSGNNLMLVEGWHFFTDQDETMEPVALKVDLFVMQGLINDWGGVLLQVYAQALCEFWDARQPDGDSRWGWLSEFLRVGLKLSVNAKVDSKQLEHDQAATAMSVVSWPDPSIRNALGGDKTRATLLQLTYGGQGEAAPATTALTEMLVVERHLRATDRWIRLTCTPGNGVKAYPTAQDMGVQVAGEWGVDAQGRLPQMGLYLPAGNIFDAQAQVLLEHQLFRVDQVGAYCRRNGKGAGFLSVALEWATCLFEAYTAPSEPTALLASRLPAWMTSAPIEERYLYADYLVRLGSLRKACAGQTFLHGIADIKTFAAQAVRRQIALDHPRQPLADLDDVRVHILTVPNAGLSIVNAGDMALEDVTISLVDLALFNLSGRPRGRMVIEPAPGKALPAWADTGGIEQLVSRTDAGSQYLALLQRELLDDPQQAPLRRKLFIDQLRLQLPMLALENQLRGQAGFTAQGYQLVERLMQQDPQSVQLAQLGFVALAGRQPDLVTNMFVIHPAAGSAGPWVLYRPLFSPALLQFADQASLLEAIAEPGALQTSVLDWMSAQARAIYGAGGFHEPHVHRFGQGSEFEALAVPPPARLGCVPVSGDPLTQLYQQGIKALINIADRQSMSTSESRWVGYQRLGWTLFNALLPIFNGPLASAGWLIQLLAAMREDVTALAGTDSGAADEALIDLFFNVALVLLSKGVPHMEETVGSPELAVEPAPSLVIDPEPRTATSMDHACLDFSWSTPRPLTAAEQLRLTAFKVPRPADLGPAVPHGLWRGLYLQGSDWLVQLGEDYYSVLPGEGDARIVDVADAGKFGPWVKPDVDGRWRLDLSLRLRGGMPPKRSIAAVRAANQARVEECKVLLRALNVSKEASARRLDALQKRVSELKQQGPSPQLSASRLELDGLIDSMLVSLADALGAAADLQKLDGSVNVSKGILKTLDSLCRLGVDSLANLFDRVKEQVVEGDRLLGQITDADAAPATFSEYFGFVEHSALVLRKQMERTAQLQQWRAKLAAVPGAGPLALMRIPMHWIERKALQSWATLLIDSQAMLVVRHIYEAPMADEFLNVVALPARLALHSQGELAGMPELELDARIDVLNSVVGQFSAVQDLIDHYRLALAGLDTTALGAFEQIILDAKVQAQKELEVLGLELFKQDRRSRRVANRLIFRSARRGWVIGKPRPVLEGTPSLMDVVEPIQNKVIATFEQDATSGDWEEQAGRDSHVAPGPALAPDLRGAMKSGRKLLDVAPREVLAAWKQSRTARIPSEMEDILVRLGGRLRGAGQAIELLLTRDNNTDEPTASHGSAQQLANSLDDKGVEVIAEGRLIRIAMIKAQPPTIERVAYLSRQGEVKVARLGERRALKKGNGFMQEYAVNDRNGATLWYAHFHYKTASALAKDYSRAHLKTLAQRFDGLQKQKAQEANGEEVTAILRSRIESPFDELFLAVE